MTTGMTLSVDTRLLERTVREATAKFDAVRVTLESPGEGEVIVSKRVKMPHERARRASKGKPARPGRKAAHGRIIAWKLAQLGHDPFAYPQKLKLLAIKYYTRNFERAIAAAQRTNRRQDKKLQEALLGTALLLAWGAAERIRDGKLGVNKLKYGKRKKRLQTAGIAQQKWGGQWPPYGVLTGRFIGDRAGSPGIRARHRNKARRSPNTRRPRRAPRDVFTR